MSRDRWIAVPFKHTLFLIAGTAPLRARFFFAPLASEGPGNRPSKGRRNRLKPFDIVAFGDLIAATRLARSGRAPDPAAI